MIRELLTYFSERPKLRVAKSFGHLVESISLLSREKRCQKSWIPHRTECKTFIASHLSLAKHKKSILVLGSGPLHEIPIELLSKTFSKVVLVDVVHLKSTIESVSHLANIQFVEHEITEIELEVQRTKKLINKVPTAFLNEDWGLVLSVNVLSQLPIHFDKFINKKLQNIVTEKEVKIFLQQITINHLNWLRLFNAPVILITDVKTIYLDKDEKVIDYEENLTHLDLPEPSNSWNWNLAPIPEFQKDVAIKMLVSAYVFNN